MRVRCPQPHMVPVSRARSVMACRVGQCWQFPLSSSGDDVRKPLDTRRDRAQRSVMDLDVDACYRAFRTRDPRFDGRLFGGVRTTRVYCRPICPAPMPKRENMTFYATAAAAQEAGFRPCLRCRPETAPEFAAWRGTSNTVSRALALIDRGALDEGGIDRLAERLGVGERQLRRLFRQHLGASPVSVAQTRRVLLAKQLIHETRLPMAEVALASGFGSIRRFNEIFQRLFDRPPWALRRATAAASSRQNGEVTILLGYRPPYDWATMVAFLKARAIPGVEVVSNDRYARTIEIDGVHGIVAVEPASGHALRVVIRFSRLSALPTIIARVRRVFDLAADPRRSTRSSRRIPSSPLWWQRGQACACRVHGMGSSSRFGPCSVSKSRWPPESAWQGSS